ncbi:hypothetical protein [Pseudonocardia sp.]|uniref:hypothetical protein n=1 Tax=Pseudonocardia sp. TaxID=60912 RepID=UPI003D09ED5A
MPRDLPHSPIHAGFPAAPRDLPHSPIHAGFPASGTRPAARIAVALLALLALLAAGCGAADPATPASPAPGGLREFAGPVPGTDAFLAVLSTDGAALAYLCAGDSLAELFDGPALPLHSPSGAELVGTVGPDGFSGTVRLADGRSLPVDLPEVGGPAGLYALVDGAGVAQRALWIVLPDGSQRGALTDREGKRRTAPRLEIRGKDGGGSSGSSSSGSGPDDSDSNDTDTDSADNSGPGAVAEVDGATVGAGKVIAGPGSPTGGTGSGQGGFQSGGFQSFQPEGGQSGGFQSFQPEDGFQSGGFQSFQPDDGQSGGFQSGYQGG